MSPLSPASSPDKLSLQDKLRDSNYQPVVVMGDGQIAMMLVQECHRLGKPVVVIGNGSSENSPKSSVQAMELNDYYIPCKEIRDENGVVMAWDFGGSETEMNALAEKLNKTGIGVTAEWENVPANLLEFFEKRGVQLTPGKKAFETMSDKGKEKEYFHEQDMPCTEWCHVDDLLNEVKAKKYLPGFLKSCKGGYDSKGQVFVNDFEELTTMLRKNKGEDGFLPGPHVLEKKIDLDYEISVVFACEDSGQIVILSTQKNHQDGPLITSVSGPGILPPEIEKQAIDMTLSATEGLGYIGTGTIEFFVSKDGKIYANEMAPRPHNSGHHTIESHEVNQYTTQALIASMGNAISAILDGRIDGISPDSLNSEGIDEEMYYRAQPKHPDMITVLVNVVGNRKNWEFPKNTTTRLPGGSYPDTDIGTPVTTWYGKPGDKNTKHGHIVVTGTREEVRARVKELLEHCYPEEHARYIAAFENNLPLAA